MSVAPEGVDNGGSFMEIVGSETNDLSMRSSRTQSGSVCAPVSSVGVRNAGQIQAREVFRVDLGCSCANVLYGGRWL